MQPIRSACATALAATALALAAGAQSVHLHPLVASPVGAGDRYGFAVDLDGKTAVVGAAFFDNPGSGSVGEGAAFVLDVETRQTLHTLLITPFGSLEQLGRAVAIEGDFIVACIDPKVGMARAPVFDTLTGQELTSLVPSTSGFYGDFGESVDLAGGVAVVGDRFWRPNLSTSADKGAAYAFEVATGQLLHEFEESSDPDIGWLGEDVATDGVRALVGAPRSDGGGKDRGAAYLYDLGTGARIAKLLPAAVSIDDQFGTGVALGGGYAAVGAPLDDQLVSNGGRVYVFQASTGALLYELTPADPAPNHSFGSTVLIDGPHLIVGAGGSSAAQAGHGAVYVFDLATRAEIFALKDAASPPEPLLGSVLAVDGDRLIHGHWGSDEVALNAGSAKTFELPARLLGAPASLSASAGGVQDLVLFTGPAQAGNPYLLLGSLSGTNPGVPTGGLPTAPVLPLNFDAYFVYTLESASAAAPPLAGALGILNAQGVASATFRLPAAAPPALVGQTVHHAYAVLDLSPLPGQPMLDKVSNPLALSIGP